MENKKPSVFVRSYDEGVNRVKEGNYAFLMESSMLDYYVQRNCNLTKIGGELDSKSYGIATPMGETTQATMTYWANMGTRWFGGQEVADRMLHRYNMRPMWFPI